MLQVSLPLSECIIGRYSAAKFRAHEKERKRRKNGLRQQVQKIQRMVDTAAKISNTVEAVKRAASRDKMRTGASRSGTGLDSSEHQKEVREAYQETLHVTQEIAKLEDELEHMPPSAKAFQFQTYIGVMQAKILSPALALALHPRRLILKCEAAGMQVVATHTAPPVIWMRLAPPKAAAAAAAADAPPHGVAAEVGIEDMRMVFSAMPSSASRLRRLCGYPRLVDPIMQGALTELRRTSRVVTHDDLAAPLQPTETIPASPNGCVVERVPSIQSLKQVSSERYSSANDGLSYHSFTVKSLSEEERLATTFFAQFRLAYRGTEMSEEPEENTLPGAKVSTVNRAIPCYEIAVWTFPLEVNFCKPLMKKVQANFKPLPYVPRWASISAQSMRFWEELQQLRQIYVVSNIRRSKKARQAELLTGVAGPLVGSRVNGQVLLRGGMRGTQFQIFSTHYKGSWMRRTAAIPTGTVEFQRVVDGGPQLKSGFQAASSSGRGMQFQSADGWWFSDESEAANQSKIFTTGLPANAEENGDDGFSGKVCKEGPLDGQQQDSAVYELPRNVLSTWGYSNGEDGTMRSRYKPPVSAKGMPPIPLPPDKRPSKNTFAGVALDCCRSMEKNLPEPMKPALAVMAATMPEDGISNCCNNSSPCAASRKLQPEATTPLMTPSAAAEGDSTWRPNRWTVIPNKSADRRSVLEMAALGAEKSISADNDWTEADMDARIEVVSSKALGLPEANEESLEKWWRTLGIIPENLPEGTRISILSDGFGPN
jgi:hypothetical protein